MGGITGKEKPEKEQKEHEHIPKAPKESKEQDKAKDGKELPEKPAKDKPEKEAREGAYRPEMAPRAAQAGSIARSGESRHFIRSELRPELVRGALRKERDVR
jgi:hypothetical protein